MRIAIDARMMGPAATRGIGRYVEELIQAMLELEPDNEYILVTRSAEHRYAKHPAVKTVVADIPWYGLAEQRLMPAILKNIRADITHIPHWNVPLVYSGPCVVTLHDLLLRHEPMSAKASTRGFFFRSLKQLGYRLVLRHAIATARRIIVPTEFVKQDVAHFYPQSKDKLVVTGEGMPKIRISNIEHRISRPDIRHSTFDIPSPYLLYVGSAYPHKGLQDLLAAWPRLAALHPQLRLMLVGEFDVFMLRLKSELEKAGLRGIEFRGQLAEAELAAAYAQAAAFVYPSHFEGFGLPPLEALAHGCPVVCADAGALVEVLGPDGAIFFRSGSADGIIAAVEKVLIDPEAARERTQKVAVELALRHAWREAARRTLQTYRAALS
ncbi:MAG: glycosyltransferase family 1 protein [Patescibacteria group bacterium]